MKKYLLSFLGIFFLYSFSSVLGTESPFLLSGKDPLKRVPSLSRILDKDKEPVKKEPGKKEPGKKEPSKKEPGKKEPVKKEPGKKEPVKKEPVKKEPVKKEPVKKEPGKKEPVKKEPGKKKRDLFFKLTSPSLKKGKILLPSKGSLKITGIIGRKKESPKVLAVYINEVKAQLKRVQYTFSEGEEVHFQIELPVKKIKKEITLGINTKTDVWQKWEVERPQVEKKKNFLLRVIGPFPGVHEGGINGSVFSPKGDFLYTTGEDELVQKWDLETQTLVWKFSLKEEGTALANLSEDSLLVGTEKGNLFLLSSDGEKTQQLEVHKDRINQMVILSGGKEILTASADGDIRLLTLEKEKLKILDKLAGHKGEVTALLYDSKGKKLYSSGIDRTLRIWDLSKKSLVTTRLIHLEVVALAFSPSGKVLTADSKGNLIEWDKDTLRFSSVLRKHYEGITSLLVRDQYIFAGDSTGKLSFGTEKKYHFYPQKSIINFMGGEGDKIFLAFSNGEGKILSLKQNLPEQLSPSKALIKKIALSEKGDSLAVGDSEGGVTLWKFEKNKGSFQKIKAHREAVMDLTLYKDSFASGGWDGSICFGPLGQNKPLQTFQGSSESIYGLKFLSEKQLFSVDIEGNIYHYSTAKAQKEKPLFQVLPSMVDLSAGTEDLALATQKTLYIYNFKGKILHQFGDQPGLQILARGEKVLAVGAKEGKILFWNLKTWKKDEKEIQLQGKGPLRWMGFSKEKELVVLTPKTVKVVDIEKEKTLLEFKVPEPVVSLALSGDGVLALSTFTNRIYLYQIRAMPKKKEKPKTPIKKIIKALPTIKKASKDEITGTWRCQLSGIPGSQKPPELILVLQLSGTQVTGYGESVKSSGRPGERKNITSGFYENKKLSIEFRMDRGALVIDAILVAPGQLKGSWKIEGPPQMNFSGAFEGTKEK